MSRRERSAARLGEAVRATRRVPAGLAPLVLLLAISGGTWRAHGEAAPWGCGSVCSVNQAATGRAVLKEVAVEKVQALADRQGGSTVHRYSAAEAKARLTASSKPFPAMVESTLVIREEERPTRAQHASTIAEVAPGVLLASWFGGTFERMGDVGIWIARYEGGRWSSPRQVAWPKPDNTYKGSMAPCWNPVLLHAPHLNTTFLFFKVGANIRR